MRTNNCRLCGEPPTDKLPFFCDYTPFEIRLPSDVHLCFWCRRDLLKFYETVEIDESQVMLWLARYVAVAADRAARGLPLHRCEVGDGRGRCTHWAVQKLHVWTCKRHAYAHYRHYLQWRCQSIRMISNRVFIFPPSPYQPIHNNRNTGKSVGGKGSLNGNSRLTEADVVSIRKMISGGEFNTTIARRFGVTHSMISAIRRNKAWTHVD
jgi:hypothetical protein